MRHTKINFWHKLAALFLVLALIAPVLFACGKEKEKTPAPTSTATSAPTATPTATPSSTATAAPTATPSPTTTPSGPVKIGAVNSWSGPAAMSGLAMADPVIKTVEKQVKDQGGILGGREVRVVRYDNRASVAEAVAGATKLFYDDKVSALVFGGVGEAEFEALADFAQEHQILYVGLGGISNLAQRTFTVNATVARDVITRHGVQSVMKILNPKTAALLATDQSDPRGRILDRKQKLEAAGVKVVYEDYIPLGAADYSPYLTKIKYANPDVVFFDSGVNEFFITIAKQIMELGGWGDIKVLSFPPGESAKAMPGAQGWYVQVLWVPGQENSGAVKFEKDYQAANGRAPTSTHVYYYNCLWTVISAIELAGTDTDRVAIAQAARSGKLEWDTPLGVAHFGTNGVSDMSYQLGRIEGGKVVAVTVPE